MRHCTTLMLLGLLSSFAVAAQDVNNVAVISPVKTKTSKVKTVLFGTASYYADKFHGRLTANGELYDQSKPTAACNELPLGTWIRVTNIKNKKWVIVRINDRLHPKMTRIVDLSRSSAEKLGYIRNGITEVKVEVLGFHKP